MIEAKAVAVERREELAVAGVGQGKVEEGAVEARCGLMSVPVGLPISLRGERLRSRGIVAAVLQDGKGGELRVGLLGVEGCRR